jgi:hypothetical protein
MKYQTIMSQSIAVVGCANNADVWDYRLILFFVINAKRRCLAKGRANPMTHFQAVFLGHYMGFVAVFFLWCLYQSCKRKKSVNAVTLTDRENKVMQLYHRIWQKDKEGDLVHEEI